MATVLLADDHPIFRKGLKSILDASPLFELIGEAADGEACVTQAELLKPNFIVTDLKMPKMNGYDIVSWTRRNLPETHVIILSMFSDRVFVEKAMTAGAAGFVAKEDSGAELLEALTFDGEFFISASAGKAVETRDFLRSAAFSDVSGKLRCLTRAERKVLQLVAQNLTSRAIAGRLGISYRTVQTHRQNIAEKLDLRGAHRLLEFALQNRDIIAGDD
ncbi:MAG: response regulator transcription factor [Hyphomicrobiales bacterium]|nr:response regulator transcription factor [Hyphomicrobiales bacterium]